MLSKKSLASFASLSLGSFVLASLGVLTVACSSTALISSTVTPLFSAPFTCSLISGVLPSAVSMARFSMERVLRSSVGSPQAQPQAQAVVARWKDIMNSSALAIEPST